MFSFTLYSPPFGEAILLPYPRSHSPYWFFHVSATDFSAIYHAWLSCFFCPDFYISNLGDFSMYMGLGNVLTLNLPLLLSTRIWSVLFSCKGICLNKYSWRSACLSELQCAWKEWFALSGSSRIAFFGCWLWPIEDKSIFSDLNYVLWLLVSLHDIRSYSIPPQPNQVVRSAMLVT